MIRILLLIAFLLAPIAASASAAESPMFPFVLPWNDASPGITDMGARSDRPAGKFGHIQAKSDGHLYAGSKRIRFFGVDIAFSADLPTHEQAEAVASRLAKFGVNIVRFHIMDSRRFPEGLLLRGTTDTRHFDPEGLDRLDYFVSQLEKRGVYANLNLLCYRPINSADGLPAEIDTMTSSVNQPRHAIGFFDEAVLGLQKEYARGLLTHVNPYTGLAYTRDPGVAFVEINNENGLLHAWLSGWLDAMPDVFLKQLQARWDSWLRQQYATTARLRAAWESKPEPLGDEMLSPGAQNEWVPWGLQQNAGAEATMALDKGMPAPLSADHPDARSAHITAVRQGRESWHILLNRPGFGVSIGKTYTLSFWARADAGCSLGVSLYQTAAPYGSLGLQTSARLSTAWKRYNFSFVTTQSDDKARVTFGDFASHLGAYWIAGVSLRPGRPDALAAEESLEKGPIPCFILSIYSERSPQAQADWRRFLWETEDQYWQGMIHYLKQDLGLKSLIIGTAVGCSTPVMMAGLDVVDAHAYWQHPQFPGRPWDPDDWLIAQRSMVNERGGIIAELALKRVMGKPRAVTEYCHPAPNGFGVEGYLLLAAYAGLQDWDYISASRYAQQNDWDLQRIRGFFDIDQHPAKMITLLPAIALFARGDVQPARQQVVVALDKERELSLLDGAHAWQLVHAGLLGVTPETALIHRVAIATTRPDPALPVSQSPPLPLSPSPSLPVSLSPPLPVPESQSLPVPLSPPLPLAQSPSPTVPLSPETRLVADTGELCWDLSTIDRGVVTVNTPRSKAVIGWGEEKRFELGGVVVEPGPTLQDGWSAITLTAMAGRLESGPSRVLITATGIVENTNMGWKDPEHTSVGRHWGEAPTLAEGIPARIEFPAPAGRVKAWALDERGQRREQVPVEAVGANRAALRIGPNWRTLWYEVDVR